MSATLERDTMTETYEDVKENVDNAVRRFYRRYRSTVPWLDPQELQSQARELFVTAFRTYQPGRTLFPQWVEYRVFKGLLEDMRKHVFRHNRLPRLHGEQSSFIAEQPSRPAFLPDFLEGLSNDAQLVVKLALDPPPDVKLATLERGKDNDKNLRKALWEFLGDLGWAAKRVTESFEEIKRALQ